MLPQHLNTHPNQTPLPCQLPFSTTQSPHQQNTHSHKTYTHTPFHDREAYGLHDYPQVIKRPMDMSTCEKKLLAGEYSNPNKFAADFRLIYKNAQTYNRSDSDIYKTAEMLARIFEKKWAKLKFSSSSGSGAAKKQREVTRYDRVRFSQMVNQLTSDQLGVMVNMIQKECPEALNEEDDDELEIEINNLDGNTLLQLIDFAENAITADKKKK
jgi:bromodomain-containing protein 3